MVIKNCKKHGYLQEKDIRSYIYKGYECLQCRLCNREWDKKKRQNEIYKQKALERRQRPEYKEKDKIRAQAYKLRRRIVNRQLYQTKKNDTLYKSKVKKWSDNKYQRMKENFDDSYIKKILKIYKNATPEMIESKRQQILEFRKIRNELKINRELLSKKNEEIKQYRKIHEILKTCKIHGDLKKDEVYYVSNGKKSISKIYICIHCKNKSSKISYDSNKPRRRKIRNIYSEKNREACRIYGKKWVERLPDSYIIRYFTKNTSLRKEDISPELLKLKRSLIMLKRKIRDMNK